MLTARDGVSDTVLGLECGADDYDEKKSRFPVPDQNHLHLKKQVFGDSSARGGLIVTPFTLLLLDDFIQIFNK